MFQNVLMFTVNRGVTSLFSDFQPFIDIVEGFLAAGKNLSVSFQSHGDTRLHRIGLIRRSAVLFQASSG